MFKFNTDNLFFRFVNKVFDVIALSILWFICSLPLFTIGASTTALYHTVLKNIRSNRGYCYKGFFQCFRDNFKNTVIPSIIYVAIILITVADMRILHNNKEVMNKFAELQIVFLVICVLVVTWAIWTFGLTARFENTWKITMKNGALMMFAHLPVTLLVAVILVVATMLCLDMPFLVAAFPVGAMFLINLLLEKVFVKYMEQSSEE